MSLARTAVRVAGGGASRRFDAAAGDVEGTQTRLLRSIAERNASTEYGREHGFGSVGSLEEWRRAAPIVTYRDIAALVDRMADGERGVLTAEDPVMFAMTSGTEGKPKLIPVTPTCGSRIHRDQMRTWFHRALQDHPTMLDAKALSLVSPAVEGRTKAGIPFGSTSGTIYRDLPWYIRRSYLVPYEVFTVEDYLAKYYVIVRLGLTAPVSFVSSANPSSIAKLCEVADEHAERLIADVRDGTIDSRLALPRAVRDALAGALRKDPERARALEAMRARRDGHLLPADFWPGLPLLGCWKGGTVGSYINKLPTWFAPDDPERMPAIRDWGYLSSEARCSVPVTDDGAGGVLAVASNVYEFVPADEVADEPDDPSRWTFLGAHEIEEPDEYNVFLTTTGGLYRYDINDIVRVVGRYREAPVIEFVRKGGGMANLTGEKLSVTQVKDAVEAAANAVGAPVQHFRALASVGSARYEFEVEFGGDVAATDAQRLVEAIDARLREQNIEYRGKRDSLRLGAPVLHVMRPGWHDAEKQRQGKRLFQSKTVLLKTVDDAAQRRSAEFRVETVGGEDANEDAKPGR
jgi:hypothetical protein